MAIKATSTPLRILALLFCISLAFDPAFAADAQRDSVAIRILTENSARLVVAIRFPTPLFVEHPGSGVVGASAIISECFTSADPGKPALPFVSLPVALPPGASPEINILSIEENEQTAPIIAPAPTLVSLPEPNRLQAEKKSFHYVFDPNSAVYRKNSFYPEKRIFKGTVSSMRGVSILPIQVYPLLYNPTSGKVRFARRLVLQIDYHADAAINPSKDKPESATAGEPATGVVINSSNIGTWKNPRTRYETALNYFLSAADSWYKIITDQPGIYSLDKASLAHASLDVMSLDPRYLRMYQDGEEIAIRVRGEKDGRFDDNDVIEFYARSFKNYYAATNVYWLGVSRQQGKRMVEENAAPQDGLPLIAKSWRRIHKEIDFYRRADFPGHTDRERWFMDRLYAPASVSYNLNFSMLADTLADCKIVLRLQGITSNAAQPDHHVVARINDHIVFDKTWDGRIALLDSALFSQSLLHKGDNLLQLSAPGDKEVLLDWQLIDYFDIEFIQDNVAAHDSFFMRIPVDSPSTIRVEQFNASAISVYDISENKNVRAINGVEADNNRFQFRESIPGDHSYVLVSDSKKQRAHAVAFESAELRQTSNQADYLIITTADFAGAALPLAEFRETQGLSTRIINVTDIYDEFGFGHVGDQPIKDFITYAYNFWRTPAPLYVLLIGDASWNPRQLGPDNENYNRHQQSDFVPTRLFEASVDHFEAASDNWFGCVDGENDLLPDVFIGRLPVRTVSELAAVIQKLITYETTYTPAPWSRTAAFVADAGEGGVLAFEDSSDAYIRDYVPGYFEAKRLYVSQLGMPQTRDQIMQTFGNGALTMNYFGHGSVGNWSAQSIFLRDDVPLLSENIYLPFLFTMSCINGYFVEPNEQYSALAEALFKEPARGAIAVFSGSGEAYPSPLQPLARTLYSSLYRHFDRIIGSMTTKALLSMYSAFPQYADHLRFYLLFGDPATRLPYYYEEDAPAYAGFAGRITVHGKPPEKGAMLLAFIDNAMMAHCTINSDSGAFGPLYIARDKRETIEKDGGMPGDSVLFKLVQASDTLALTPKAPWLKGKVLSLQLAAVATAVEKESVQFFVDQRVVGLDFIDGETIAKTSVISATVAVADQLDDDAVRLYLNKELIDAQTYTIFQPESGDGKTATIQFAAEGLQDGDYELSLAVRFADDLRSSFRAGFRFAIKSELALSHIVNFPNPFSEKTLFTFVMDNDQSAFVKIKIYTVAGRLIRVLDRQSADVGYNEIEWDGRDEAGDGLANGVYFYKIIADDGNGTAEAVERLVVMK